MRKNYKKLCEDYGVKEDKILSKIIEITPEKLHESLTKEQEEFNAWFDEMMGKFDEM